MKSNFVKNIYAQYLVYIMTCYKQNLIAKTNQLLQETMKALLSDANGGDKGHPKEGFYHYRKRFYENLKVKI